MEYLSDELLLESYYRALELHLSSDFIKLITEEMEQRNLTYKKKQGNKQFQ